MASEVDICNLALSHFGQAANVSAINPPDGSMEAEQCKRFYPIALAELLEEFDWSFARKRATLAEVANDRDDFAYKYARPSDCVRERRLLAEGYGSDQGDGASYQREGDYLYSDASLATLVYTRTLTDTTKFSPLFVITLSWRLASYLVGPIVKDPSGRTAVSLRSVADRMAAQAKVSDANGDRDFGDYTSTAESTR